MLEAYDSGVHGLTRPLGAKDDLCCHDLVVSAGACHIVSGICSGQGFSDCGVLYKYIGSVRVGEMGRPSQPLSGCWIYLSICAISCYIMLYWLLSCSVFMSFHHSHASSCREMPQTDSSQARGFWMFLVFLLGNLDLSQNAKKQSCPKFKMQSLTSSSIAVLVWRVAANRPRLYSKRLQALFLICLENYALSNLSIGFSQYRIVLEGLANLSSQFWLVEIDIHRCHQMPSSARLVKLRAVPGMVQITSDWDLLWI